MAASDPSGVKGTAVESVVADVKQLLEDGRLRREELEARLTAQDLELLEEKILPSSWYSLGSYGRLTEILFEREGRQRVAYLVERGRRAAERLRGSGLYSQFRADKERWGDQVGKLLVTLGPAIYKDTRWSYEVFLNGDTMRYRIEVEVPAEFPDLCRHQTQGFIEYVTAQFGRGNLRVSSERAASTLLVFHGDPG